MASVLNSAQRLKNFFDDYVQKAPINAPSYEYWASVFYIDDADANKKMIRVAVSLNGIHDLIEETEIQLVRKDFPRDLITPNMNSLRSIISPQNYMQPKSSLHPAYNTTVQHALSMYTHIIKNTENDVSEDISRIKNQIAELKKSLSDSSLSDEFKDYLVELCNRLELLLRNYRVIGGRAITQSLDELMLSGLKNKKLFAENADSPLMPKIKSVITGLYTIAEKAIVINEAVGMISDYAPIIQSLANQL